MDEKILNKLNSISLLIVEDDKLAANAIKQAFAYYCKEVFVEFDGLLGYESFCKNHQDVVIADINLPSLDGLKMIELIHEISPHTKIIIITSYDTSENMLKSMKKGACSYLRKPIKIEDLQTTLLFATKDITSQIIELKNDFFYDLKTRELCCKNEQISLTKSEKLLFDLLVRNKSKTIQYSVIEDYVYKDKSMSKYALRMCIKKIRLKTYSDIIKNIFDLGYKID